MAAEKVTPEAINFMASKGRGLICVAVAGQRLDELRIPPMVTDNTSPHETAFCISVDAKRKVTTGISAHDRAVTIRTIIDPKATADDLTSPGHTFPLRAREGGVLTRAGQTEAAVDLARLAGLYPAADHRQKPDRVSIEARAIREPGRHNGSADTVRPIHRDPVLQPGG
jgi:3,4-dihydroxy 2-butanone 4-phosphate synthase/GTP cyclohydrolase II